MNIKQRGNKEMKTQTEKVDGICSQCRFKIEPRKNRLTCAFGFLQSINRETCIYFKAMEAESICDFCKFRRKIMRDTILCKNGLKQFPEPNECNKQEGKSLTKKQFDELCKTHEPIYIGNETDGKHDWSIWNFEGIEGEYHQLDNKVGN
jgi:hypothetical protein